MSNTGSDPQFPLHNMAYTRKSLFNKEMSFVYLLIEDVADLEHGET